MPDFFVVNVAQAPAERHPLGATMVRFDTPGARFAEVGVNIRILEPGCPASLYHRENVQEDFLVLTGECLAILDGEERALRAWDFVHCPAGTACLRRRWQRTVRHPDGGRSAAGQGGPLPGQRGRGAARRVGRPALLGSRHRVRAVGRRHDAGGASLAAPSLKRAAAAAHRPRQSPGAQWLRSALTSSPLLIFERPSMPISRARLTRSSLLQSS